MRALIDPDEATRRLELIFPRGAFDTTLSGALAGWAVAGMIYTNAVASTDGDTVWIRPSGIIWQQADVLATRTSTEDRLQWYRAISKNHVAVQDLLKEWDLTSAPRFRENSRETLRDEIFGTLRNNGAIRQRAGLPTSSSKPRWALESHFANLFDPLLTGDEFLAAIDTWTSEHLDAGSRLKALRSRATADRDHEVLVQLPGEGGTRSLEPSESSRILKGVIEEWAPRRLNDPIVLTISEPGDKLYVQDQQQLSTLGINIDVSNLLPDALIADLGTNPVTFWIIEAVATDGPITDHRKDQLLTWAADQHISPDSCQFLTAFSSRGSSPARRRLKDLAASTYAWYLDEPTMELQWDQISGRGGTVIPIRPSR